MPKEDFKMYSTMALKELVAKKEQDSVRLRDVQNQLHTDIKNNSDAQTANRLDLHKCRDILRGRDEISVKEQAFCDCGHDSEEVMERVWAKCYQRYRDKSDGMDDVKDLFFDMMETHNFKKGGIKFD